MHHKEDGYDSFEDISAMVKETNFKIKDPEPDTAINEKAKQITNKEALEFIEKVKLLLSETPDLRSPDQKAYVKQNP